jgi:hypothetical protein
MASRSALALAVMGLVGMSLPMQVAAQTSSAVASKPVLKAVPVTAGNGKTAKVSVNDGGGGNGSSTQTCTVNMDGTVACATVEVSGSSSGGGGGGNVQPPVVVTGSSSGGSGGDSFYLPIENPHVGPGTAANTDGGSGGWIAGRLFAKCVGTIAGRYQPNEVAPWREP